MEETNDPLHTYRIVYETNDLQKEKDVKGYIKLLYEVMTIATKGFTILKISIFALVNFNHHF